MLFLPIVNFLSARDRSCHPLIALMGAGLSGSGTVWGTYEAVQQRNY